MPQKCPACGRRARRAKRVDVTIFGVTLGAFDAEVCDECGEALFTSRGVDEIESRAKELGLWGLASKEEIYSLFPLGASGRRGHRVSERHDEELDLRDHQ